MQGFQNLTTIDKECDFDRSRLLLTVFFVANTELITPRRIAIRRRYAVLFVASLTTIRTELSYRLEMPFAADNFLLMPIHLNVSINILVYFLQLITRACDLLHYNVLFFKGFMSR